MQYILGLVRQVARAICPFSDLKKRVQRHLMTVKNFFFSLRGEPRRTVKQSGVTLFFFPPQ